jgi:hypothetical protein
MRPWVLLLLIVLCVLPPLGWAQESSPTDRPPLITPTPPPEAPPGTTPPNAPTGPGTSPQELPPPEEPAPAPGTRRVTLRANRFIVDEAEGTVQLIGNVSVQSGNTVIRAGEATYTNATQILLARGNVSIRAEDGNTYFGNLLEFNAGTRDWRFLDFSTTFPPSYLGQPFIAPVFLGGEDISGLPNGLRARNARVTTCDLPNPHYVFTSRRVDVYPGDKLIAYDTNLYVLGHKVLHLPWLYLSLREHRSPIVPEAGKNDYEGYYLRLLYQYVLDPDELGGIRLDLTQKLGIGAGVDHFYTVKNGFGEAFIYGRQSLSEYALRVDHTQHLPARIDATGHLDLRRNSLFSFNPVTNTDLGTTLTRNTTHSNTQLNITRRLNQGTFSTDNTSANVRYNVNTTGGSMSLNSAYSRYGSTTTTSEDLWNHLTMMRKIPTGSFNLRIDERAILANSAAVTSGVQRLPEVQLVSDDISQISWNPAKFLPSKVTAGWGYFDEEPGNTKLDRYLLEWQLGNLRRGRYGGSTDNTGKTIWQPTAQVRQTFYGDKDFTAQYNFNSGLTGTSYITPALTNTVRYTRQESHGYTPFRFDKIYPYESVTESANFDNRHSLQLGTGRHQRFDLATGRDLRLNRWQDLTARSDTELFQGVGMTNSTAYDLNNHLWRDLVSQLTWEKESLVNLKVGTRYNLNEGQLSNVSTDLAWIISPKWRVQWLNGYDGLRHEMLYNEILVVRDLHCWDAALYYSYQQKYVFLHLRMKALNLAIPGFGIGRGGQVLDTTSLGSPF